MQGERSDAIWRALLHEHLNGTENVNTDQLGNGENNYVSAEESDNEPSRVSHVKHASSKLTNKLVDMVDMNSSRWANCFTG